MTNEKSITFRLFDSMGFNVFDLDIPPQKSEKYSQYHILMHKGKHYVRISKLPSGIVDIFLFMESEVLVIE